LKILGLAVLELISARRGCPRTGRPRNGRPRNGRPRNGRPRNGRPRNGRPRNGRSRIGTSTDSGLYGRLWYYTDVLQSRYFSVLYLCLHQILVLYSVTAQSQVLYSL
jgi:hypothetical protein